MVGGGIAKKSLQMGHRALVMLISIACETRNLSHEENEETKHPFH